MPATHTSWKISPFQEGRSIPYNAVWSQEQFDRIAEGLVPTCMEDKWFVFFEEPHLYFHRSWTGLPIYKITIQQAGSTYEAKETQSACSSADGQEPELAYQAELLDFLVSNLLLGENKPFPLPPNIQTSQPPGALQHVISGTGYKEQPGRLAKRWWHFWK